MPNRGSVNRRTGKTTPRSKVKTHWGAKASRTRTPISKKPRKGGARKSSKS